MTFSRRLAKVTILTIALGLTAVLAVGVWRGKTQKEQRAVTLSEPSEAEMRLTDMEYTEMQEGRQLWTLKASEAKYFQDEQKTQLRAVRITFFMQNGEEIRLEGQNGTLYAGSKNIELWNAVHATLPQGYELSTERAFYDHQQKRISSETLIQVTGPDAQVQGNRWEYRISESQAILEGEVRASLILMPREEKPTM